MRDINILVGEKPSEASFGPFLSRETKRINNMKSRALPLSPVTSTVHYQSRFVRFEICLPIMPIEVFNKMLKILNTTY